MQNTLNPFCESIMLNHLNGTAHQHELEFAHYIKDLASETDLISEAIATLESAFRVSRPSYHSMALAYLALCHAERQLAAVQVAKPRLLEIREFSQHEYLYMEFRTDLVPCKPVQLVSAAHGGINFIAIGIDSLGVMESDYNRSWRCWDKLPTKAERAVAKWRD